jgi:[ribosomal protein S18]-alanine N-acetyltransferase
MKRLPRASLFDVELRNGRLSDLDALLALERELFSSKLFTSHLISRASFRRFLASSKTTKLIVAGVTNQIAGYVLVFYRANSRLARMYSIGVAAHYRRRGLARKLLSAAEKNATRRGCHAIRLEVREDDATAIALYESAGYRLFGKVAGYYDGHVDALRFEKPLGSFEKPLARELRAQAAISHRPA